MSRSTDQRLYRRSGPRVRAYPSYDFVVAYGAPCSPGKYNHSCVALIQLTTLHEKDVVMRHPLAVVVVLALFAKPVDGQTQFPGGAWTIAQSPAALGWDSVALARARMYSDSIKSTAVLVVQDGVVVTQWGDVNTATELHSVRKSLLSALIGIAVSRHQLDTTATLAQLGISDHPEPPTESEQRAQVRYLMTSRSGVYHPAAYETRAMAAQRPSRGSHAPGNFFYYNNWDFNALGTIYEQAVGRSIFDDFLTLIAGPIGMQDLRREDMRYFREPVSQHPAYLFRMSARDLARFGLLYLNHGTWAGRAIISSDWVRWSTSALVDTGVRGGYGAMWWVATNPADPIISVPVGTYSARGTGEQNLFVFPPWRLVIVHRANPDQGPMRVQEFGRLLRLILSARQGT